MIYIMHRTQLYLDDNLWTTLKARAQRDGTTISELVRVAARERYMDHLERRRAAMEAFVGIRSDRPEFEDVDGYIRNLRKDTRTQRLGLE